MNSGEVEDVDYRRNGSLLITCKSKEQVQTIINTTQLPISKIKTKGSLAWSSQTINGVVFAPEFVEDSLEYLLEMLKPCGVIAIRKMFQDPNRASAPLYVLTFLGNTCPENIKVGYSSYEIELYYQPPSLCSNCSGWGHIRKHCHGKLKCGRCGQTGHHKSSCKAEYPKCPNCAKEHEATNKTCEAYIKEKEIGRIRTEQNVAYNDAREIYSTQNEKENTRIQQTSNNTKQAMDINNNTFPRFQQGHSMSRAGLTDKTLYRDILTNAHPSHTAYHSQVPHHSQMIQHSQIPQHTQILQHPQILQQSQHLQRPHQLQHSEPSQQLQHSQIPHQLQHSQTPHHIQHSQLTHQSQHPYQLQQSQLTQHPKMQYQKNKYPAQLFKTIQHFSHTQNDSVQTPNEMFQERYQWNMKQSENTHTADNTEESQKETSQATNTTTQNINNQTNLQHTDNEKQQNTTPDQDSTPNYTNTSNPYNADTQLLTPGQKYTGTNIINNESDNSFSQFLPPLSPQYRSENTQEYTTSSSQGSTNQTKDTQTENLMDIIVKILPILIKLFTSNTTASKVECFLEIGSILKVDRIVSDALINQGITSLSN